MPTYLNATKRSQTFEKNVAENAKLDKRTFSGVTGTKDNLSGLRSDDGVSMYRSITADHSFIRFSLKKKGKIQQRGM